MELTATSYAILGQLVPRPATTYALFGLDVIAWAERSLAELEGWDDLSPDGKTERALEVIAAQIARYPV